MADRVRWPEGDGRENHKVPDAGAGAERTFGDGGKDSRGKRVGVTVRVLPAGAYGAEVKGGNDNSAHHPGVD